MQRWMLICVFQDDYKCRSSLVLYIQGRISAGMGRCVYYDYTVTVMYPLLGINLLHHHHHKELQGLNINGCDFVPSGVRRECRGRLRVCCRYKKTKREMTTRALLLYQTRTSIWKLWRTQCIKMDQSGLFGFCIVCNGVNLCIKKFQSQNHFDS